jgi:8-oxo-dGTP diphosphatase
VARKGLIVDLHLVLRQGDRILLGLRRNTGYSDGIYHLPAGHLEEGETVVAGAIREAREEIGVDIEPADLELVHVMHNRSGRVSSFFDVARWSGDIVNAEPDKCEALDWFAADRLPTNMVRYARAALDLIEKGSTLGLYGWKSEEET